jgi:hypothetical protein
MPAKELQKLMLRNWVDVVDVVLVACNEVAVRKTLYTKYAQASHKHSERERYQRGADGVQPQQAGRV